jgi:hypothetical protein
MKISPELFAIVCFLVMMESGEGIMGKSPNDIGEKRYLLLLGFETFGALNPDEQNKVEDWCKKWGVDTTKMEVIT